MKMYIKPSIEVIELQLKEDIAAVPTTVYKGKTRQTSSVNYDLKAEGGINLSDSIQTQYGVTISGW